MIAEGKMLPFSTRGWSESMQKNTEVSKVIVTKKTFREQSPAPAG
jgi:hypothetical protein